MTGPLRVTTSGKQGETAHLWCGDHDEPLVTIHSETMDAEMFALALVGALNAAPADQTVGDSLTNLAARGHA